MNVEAKEQHIGRLQTENKQARRNYMTAAKNAESNMGGMVGANLMGKLNLPGVSSSISGGGYKPKMFGMRGNDATSDAGNQSDRSFASKFGTSNAVSASVDISSNRFASGGMKSNLLGMS